MKLVSWNLNGIRAAYNKELLSFIGEYNPDLFCIQETKAQKEQLSEDQCNPLSLKGSFSSAKKKGYSGVATFYNPAYAPASFQTGIGLEKFDSEGRFIISEHSDFDLYNIYFPSGTTGDVRQQFKYEFLDAVFDYLTGLPEDKLKRCVICGDFNICHKEIDIHHPDKATKLELSGFLPQERAWMDEFSSLGFIDSFRHINGPLEHKYSWWSFRAQARQKNLGWRIDYIFVHKSLANRVKNAGILSNITGSDHAPIFIDFE